MTRDLHIYEKQLNEEKATLSAELKQVSAIEVDTIRSDASDVADRLEVYEGRANSLRQLNSRLAEINAALEKIKNNDATFGTCHICGKNIEDDRLAANPGATTCKEHITRRV